MRKGTVEIWVAKDGKRFFTEQECRDHETMLYCPKGTMMFDNRLNRAQGGTWYVHVDTTEFIDPKLWMKKFGFKPEPGDYYFDTVKGWVSCQQGIEMKRKIEEAVRRNRG